MVNISLPAKHPGPLKPPGLASRIAALPLIGIVRIYRYSLSAFMGRTCRFMPSCSE